MKSVRTSTSLVFTTIFLVVLTPILMNIPIALAAPRSGQQDFAVICARFSDIAATRWSTTEIANIMDTINDFWYNASYGTVTIAHQVEGWYNLGNTIASYQDALGNLFPNGDDIIDDAIALADPDVDFSQYDFVLVWINTWFRGLSFIGNVYSITTSDGTFNVGASLVGENSPDLESEVWGRVAHEMGHAFGLEHTHLNYNSDFALMARGYPSDLIVYSQVFDGVTGWFDSNNNQEDILPGDPQGDFILRPRALEITGDLQSLRVEISSSKYYLVEVVKFWSEDNWVPDEGALIYLVDASKTVSACEDMDSPTGTLWDVGEKFTDVANSITVEIVEAIADGFKIRVNNDAGAPDLMITPWGAPPYETPDIWVDSPVNGWDFYRHRDSQGNPIGNGDEPWANHENRLYARIHNIGQVDAFDVKVKFFFTSPIGAGNPDWDLVNETTVNIAHGSSEPVYVPWTPEIEVSPGESGILPLHGCARVEIVPVPEETTLANNNAQENIGFFEVVPGSDFEPLQYSFRIWNPFETPTEIYVNIIDVTPGWTIQNATGIGEFHLIPGLGKKDFVIWLVPNPGIGFGIDLEAQVFMGYYDWVDDDFKGDVVLRQYGGISISATTMYRTSINISASVISDTIQISGTLGSIDDLPSNLFPEKGGDRNILLEIKNEQTQTTEVMLVEMNETGVFGHSFSGIVAGTYTIAAFYEGSDILTSASVNISATVKEPPKPPIEIVIVVVLLVIVVLILWVWRIKS